MNEFEWWINQNQLSNYEKKLILKSQQITNEEIIPSLKQIKQNLFKYIPLSEEISNYTLSFSNRATNFINELFDKYVDDNTLIIISDCEHNNVKTKAKQFSNLLEIKNLNIDFNYVKTFKKVFVYFIGTQISSGIITPQSFFIDLKQFLIKNKIEHKLVLDAVQEMFLLPRDYSLFDYIIGTAHSLIVNFDLGILLSKENSKLGRNIGNKGEKLVELLKIFTSRKYKLQSLRYLLRDHYYKYIKLGICQEIPNSIYNIFSLRINKKIFTQEMREALSKYYIKLEGIDNDIQFIRFRAQHYITNPEALILGLKTLDNLLEEIL